MKIKFKTSDAIETMTALSRALMVKEHPIIFSGLMVKAIINGRKTMTRRVIKPQPPIDVILKEHSEILGLWLPYTSERKLRNDIQGNRKNDCGFYSPYQVGDILWVKETWASYDSLTLKQQDIQTIFYKANYSEDDFKTQFFPKWQSPIYMPRWASRITLEILKVRIEKLQDISPKDVIAEGIPETEEYEGLGLLDKFVYFWDSLNVKNGFGWDKNPGVWVIEFKTLS